jgi:hypothetical protein
MRTVTISGLLQCPYYYQVLEVVKTGRIFAIKRNTHLVNSRVNYSVTVGFVEAAAAKGLLYQYLTTPIEIEGQQLEVGYNPDDLSDDNFDTNTTRVLHISIPMPPSAGLPPIFGAKLTRVSTLEAARFSTMS